MLRNTMWLLYCIGFVIPFRYRTAIGGCFALAQRLNWWPPRPERDLYWWGHRLNIARLNKATC